MGAVNVRPLTSRCTGIAQCGALPTSLIGSSTPPFFFSYLVSRRCCLDEGGAGIRVITSILAGRTGKIKGVREMPVDPPGPDQDLVTWVVTSQVLPSVISII